MLLRSMIVSFFVMLSLGICFTTTTCTYAAKNLLEAAETGDLKRVVELTAKKIDVDSMRDKDGYTPLMLASQNGHAAIVRRLINKSADVNCKNKFNGTALMWATTRGHTEVVELLLKAKADVHAMDRNLDSVIIWAAKGNATIVERLIHAGVNVNDRNCYGLTPLIRAASEGKEEICVRLLEAGADPTASRIDGGSALNAAKHYGYTEIACLIEAAKTKWDEEEKFLRDTTLLDFELLKAAEIGDTTKVKKLLKKGARVNTVKVEYGLTGLQPTNVTPLMSAAYGGHLETVKLLLEKGADVTSFNQVGDTPLTLAARKGHTAIARELLDHGADVEGNHKATMGIYESTPLMCAALHGHLGTVKLLVERRANLLAKSGSNTALDLTRLGHYKEVEDYLKTVEAT